MDAKETAIRWRMKEWGFFWREDQWKTFGL